MTPLILAEAFCDMDDEAQAQFFIEAARIAAGWERGSGFGAWWQWDKIGGHLRDCKCATPEAREMVNYIDAGMAPKE